MIKRIALSSLFCLFSIIMMAVPAKPGLWRSITLTDGTVVRAQLMGDEFTHWWQDADGNQYVLNQTSGRFSKKTVDATAGLSKRRKAQAAVARQAARRAASGSLFKGQKRGLIILAQFPNSKFSMDDPQAFFNRFANEIGFHDGNFQGSVRDYFLAQSGGQFDLEFDVKGPVTVANNYQYYGRNVYVSGQSQDNCPEEMIKEALDSIADSTDFTPYDWDNDGNVEEVFVIYAGHGEADYNDATTIWPHMYQLSYTNVGAQTYGGKTVDVYACSSELGSTAAVDGIGTVCHEFSHCMGFPDVYDVANGGNYGMGRWDLMCYGSYNGDTFVPSNYTGYERAVCGWTTPVELTADTVITDMKSLTNMGQTYLIRNPNYDNEYYILENRQLDGFDAEQYGHGLLVTYVDYDENVWSNNCPNTTSGYYSQINDHQRITILPADNRASYYNEQSDPFPYNGNDSLTMNSKPATTVYHQLSDGSRYLPIAITGITEHDDSTISFNFTKIAVAPKDTTNNEDGDVLFKETFDQCNGTGGNDGRFSGGVAFNKFKTDNSGWEYAGSAYGADQCARFNSSSMASGAGYVITPSFTLVGDTATLTFKAACWKATGDGTGLQVTLSGAGSIANAGTDTLLTMQKGAWTTYTLKLVGNGATRVCFTPDRRFFLDEVVVTKPVTNGISYVRSEKRADDKRIFTLSGQYVGTQLSRLPKGIYIVNGRKVVRP